MNQDCTFDLFFSTLGSNYIVFCRTISKKIGGKSAITHKKVHLTRNGAERWGAKSLKKKRGDAKSHN
jgi:hypothetical protein